MSFASTASSGRFFNHVGVMESVTELFVVCAHANARNDRDFVRFGAASDFFRFGNQPPAQAAVLTCPRIFFSDRQKLAVSVQFADKGRVQAARVNTEAAKSIDRAAARVFKT